MCVISYHPDIDYDSPGPTSRARPLLAWALPVDVVELGASLEAYSCQLSQITTFVLCTKLGHGPISSLPQEIIDQIIDHAQEAMKAQLRPKWNLNYLCFQGRCERAHHFTPNGRMVDSMWNYVWNEESYAWDRPAEEVIDATDEDKQEMVREYLEDNGYESYDESVYEEHRQRQDLWLDQVCRCYGKSAGSQERRSFVHLHKLLQSHFGLDAILLHEVVSPDLMSFLPDKSVYGYTSYYTTCFLSLSSPKQVKCSTQPRTATHRNDVYLEDDNHLAYHRVMDADHLGITELQKLRFPRAMRLLGIQPHYHLTELASIASRDKDRKAFWAAYEQQLAGITKKSHLKKKKKELLDQYLRAKSQEISKQAWPKLMLMSTSDAVCPTG